MEENNATKVLYSYDRESYNDEEARKRYSAYMNMIMAAMAEAHTKLTDISYIENQGLPPGALCGCRCKGNGSDQE